MIDIPRNIKELFLRDNNDQETLKKLKLTFFDERIDSLYPYETLFPEESLFPYENDVPWLTIENDRIVSESFQKTESLCEDEDIVFGSCEGAEVQVTVADVIEDVTGREFRLSVEVGGYEIMLGYYTVKSFVRQSDRRKRKITAYDRMQWFNVDVASWYNNLSFPMTLKAFRNSLCDYIGIKQEVKNLLFDNMMIEKTIKPEQLQGIDVLKAICEINGCFGHINIVGELTYIYLQQSGLYPAENLFPKEDLYPSEYGGDGMPVEVIRQYKQPMTYEDYLIDGIDSLTIREEEGDVGASVGDGNNTYVIEGNFLIYGKSATELLNIANSLFPYIKGRVYKPSSVDTNGRPWIEVGDAIYVPTRDDIVETFVMTRSMTGTQNIRDKYSSTGSKVRGNQTTIHKQIVQLEGKTAVIIKNVDEVSAKVTDLKEYTEAQFKITADSITAEVKRATKAEGDLSSRITVNANNISLKVSKGEVSSQLSVESGKVTISSNRLIVNSTNFKLDGNGNATFSGKITGGTINIGNNFAVDANGKVTAKGASFNGSISGSGISGGWISIGENFVGNKGFFEADSDNIFLGNYTVNSDVQDTFENESIGFSVSGDVTGNAQVSTPYGIWGYNFELVNGDFKTDGDVYAQWEWSTQWSLCWQIQDLYDKVESGPSDIRLKSNIQYIKSADALNKVLGLKPCTFNLNKRVNPRKIEHNVPSIGIIAQDALGVVDDYPIVKTGADGFYRVDYQGIIPLLIASVQELNDKLEAVTKNENTNI